MTVKLSNQEVLAIEIANDIVAGATISQSINEKGGKIRKLRKGKPLGTARSGDAVCLRFKETLEKKGLGEQTIKNYLVDFRKMVNDGVPFNMNPKRAKGAQTSPKAKGAKVNGVSFKGEAKIEDIVKGLRGLFNKMKQDDKTAELASFLLDAVDEFEGK
jgi:hypothetical protein